MIHSGGAILLTHGAGSNADAPLLVALAKEFEAAGVVARRYTLPFRQQRPKGPPFPAQAERDREGIRENLIDLGGGSDGPSFIGGHSYGGRQASILASEQPKLAGALLLLAYPLHPPDKPQNLRTAHFPSLRTPSFFVHGTRDPFATSVELAEAIKLIPARVAILELEGTGHDLLRSRSTGALQAVTREIAANFLRFVEEIAK